MSSDPSTAYLKLTCTVRATNISELCTIIGHIRDLIGKGYTYSESDTRTSAAFEYDIEEVAKSLNNSDFN